MKLSSEMETRPIMNGGHWCKMMAEVHVCVCVAAAEYAQ